MKDVFIYDGLRSPIGRHAGSLSNIRPDDLAAAIIKAVIKRNNIPSDVIEDVVIGNTNQAGEDSRNLGRHAALLAGLPTTVGGITINRLCGSGLAAIADSARIIACDQGEAIIAGGCESMSRAPWVMAKAETAFSRQQSIEDSTIGARFANPVLTSLYGDDTMVQTADNVAATLNISRERCDSFALASQKKYFEAKQSGHFNNEIAPVQSKQTSKDQQLKQVDEDEHPRPTVTIDKLSKLSPINTNGVVTAGNASGINDGAAILLLGSEKLSTYSDMQPRAKIISSAIAGVEPKLMGLGPVPASQKALQRAGLTMDEMDIIEINEAFSAQVLGCLQSLGIADNDARVNAWGGAIAVGHPLAASGARLVLTALNQLEQKQCRYALVTLCIGVGQGIAMVIERVAHT